MYESDSAKHQIALVLYKKVDEKMKNSEIKAKIETSFAKHDKEKCYRPTSQGT